MEEKDNTKYVPVYVAENNGCGTAVNLASGLVIGILAVVAIITASCIICGILSLAAA